MGADIFWDFGLISRTLEKYRNYDKSKVFKMENTVDVIDILLYDAKIQNTKNYCYQITNTATIIVQC